MHPVFRVLLLLVGAGLVLAACAAPRGPSALNRPAAERTASSGTVIVRPGDTLYAIAKRNGVSPRALIDANGLRPPYLLRAGDRLVVPGARVHVVRSGDTVSEIAERYRVSTRAIVVLNGLKPPYLIRVGDRLRLPTATARPPAAPSGSTVVAARTPRAPLLPLPGPTLRSNQQTTTTGQPWSGGGQLHFPRSGSSAADVIPLPVLRPRSPAPTRVAAPAPSTAPSAAPAPRAVPVKSQVVALTPPPKMGGGFRWPVQGRVISGFGPREGGLHNDGVNILVAAGTQIRAAENGIVVYAGNELRGFGNLLLVKHANNWTTAYAHADRLLVGRGDRVTRGQVIATVGQTGNVSRSQLHFEIRKGQRPVDPRKQLPPLQLSALPQQ